MATRPCEATFNAYDNPAMPLPRTRKSNCFINSQALVVDQARSPDKHRQGHLLSGGDCACRNQGLRVKEFNVVQARGRLCFDKGFKLRLETLGGKAASMGSKKSFH